MQRYLIVITLIFTTWALLPDAAQAHADGCTYCEEIAGEPGEDHRSGHDCHHGAGCGVIAMTASNGALLAPSPTRSLNRLECPTMPRSALVALDLPPPRA